MTEEELDYIKAILDHIEVGDVKLSQWQEGFFADQRKRTDEYGTETFMSEKQWKQIVKVGDELGLEDPRKPPEPWEGDIDDEIPF